MMNVYAVIEGMDGGGQAVKHGAFGEDAVQAAHAALARFKEQITDEAGRRLHLSMYWLKLMRTVKLPLVYSEAGGGELRDSVMPTGNTVANIVLGPALEIPPAALKMMQASPTLVGWGQPA